ITGLTVDAARRAAGFVRGDDVVIHKIFTEFIDRENELRQSKPPTTQPPPRVPLDPWARSRLMRQDAPPKEEKTSDSDP
ncbi:unnamed protein product, partial [Brassica rapa subsp. trilocularis]